MQGMIN